MLWGSCVVLPPKARGEVLIQLHEGHPGMTRMKALARMYIWWPGLEKDIESTVSSCNECQMLQPALPVSPLYYNPGNGQHDHGRDYTSAVVWEDVLGVDCRPLQEDRSLSN